MHRDQGPVILLNLLLCQRKPRDKVDLEVALNHFILVNLIALFSV